LFGRGSRSDDVLWRGILSGSWRFGQSCYVHFLGQYLGPSRGVPKRRYCLVSGLRVVASREAVFLIVLVLFYWLLVWDFNRGNSMSSIFHTHICFRTHTYSAKWKKITFFHSRF